jgi:hypothetical protein
LAWLTQKEWANFANGHGLAIDFVVVINLLLEMRGDFLKAPLANDRINFAEVINVECHIQILSRFSADELSPSKSYNMRT